MLSSKNNRERCLFWHQKRVRLCLLSRASLPWVCFLSTQCVEGGGEMSCCQQQHGLAQRHKGSHLSVEAFLVAGETDWCQAGLKAWHWALIFICCHDTWWLHRTRACVSKYAIQLYLTVVIAILEMSKSQRRSHLKNRNITVLILLSVEFPCSV